MVDTRVWHEVAPNEEQMALLGLAVLKCHGHGGSLATKLAFQGNFLNFLNASQGIAPISHAQLHRVLLLPRNNV